MSSPAEKVFNIPELHEMILTHVDMKTVLLAQRTSRAFHATITSSPRLQRKLWMQPHKIDQTGAAADEPSASRSSARLNPLLVQSSRRLGFKTLLLWKGTDKTQPLIIDFHYRSLETAEKIPPGSWERMIIMQPHLPSARFELGVFDPAQEQPKNATMQDAEQKRRRVLHPLGVRAGPRRPTRKNRVVRRYLLPTTASILRHDLLAHMKGCRCGFCEERERRFGHVKF
ncbi:hypothetical protein NU219Hw_g5264t1 [Hortaea werneckii]